MADLASIFDRLIAVISGYFAEQIFVKLSGINNNRTEIMIIVLELFLLWLILHYSCMKILDYDWIPTLRYNTAWKETIKQILVFISLIAMLSPFIVLTQWFQSGLIILELNTVEFISFIIIIAVVTMSVYKMCLQLNEGKWAKNF